MPREELIGEAQKVAEYVYGSGYITYRFSKEIAGIPMSKVARLKRGHAEGLTNEQIEAFIKSVNTTKEATAKGFAEAYRGKRSGIGWN